MLIRKNRQEYQERHCSDRRGISIKLQKKLEKQLRKNRVVYQGNTKMKRDAIKRKEQQVILWHRKH